MQPQHDDLLAEATWSLMLISAPFIVADIGFCIDLAAHQRRDHSIRLDSLWLRSHHMQINTFCGLSAAPITIPDSTFLTFMDCAKGAAGKSLMQLAYEGATGQNVQYIELSSGNHYVMNDWNPASAPHQVRNPTVHLSCHQHKWCDLFWKQLVFSMQYIANGTVHLGHLSEPALSPCDQSMITPFEMV